MLRPSAIHNFIDMSDITQLAAFHSQPISI